MVQTHSQTVSILLPLALLLSGCTSTLVRDNVKRTAGLDGHCAGSEWVDDSSLAVLPVVAEQILQRVEVSGVAC